MKKLMITKNLVVKIQNLVVIHESWPVKSKPDTSRYSRYIVSYVIWRKKQKVLLYFGVLLFFALFSTRPRFKTEDCFK